MKANIEQIVDWSKVAVSEKEWTINKIRELANQNSSMQLEDILNEVENLKDVSIDDIVGLAEMEEMQPAKEDIEKNLLDRKSVV